MDADAHATKPPPCLCCFHRTRGLPTPKYNDSELFQAMEGELVR